MKHSLKKSLMFVIITLALLVSALGVTPAFADDETPPPPATEEPVQQEPAQAPVVDTEPEVVATQPPVEATSVPEVTEEEVKEDIVPTEAPPEATLLSEVPENTDIVALDENDEPLPLTSQDAADVLVEADPKWCPEGELPNSANCSANFPTIADLLTDMRDHPENYSKDGVIYFERAALTTFTSSFVLDDSAGSLAGAYDTLKAYNITLTGGWSGGSSTNFPGHSLFSGPDEAFMQVGTASNPWIGNVTLNNIQIGDNTNGGVSTNNSVTVYTTSGDITLNNVDVYQQAGDHYTAYLESDSGDITVGPSLNLAAPGGNGVFDGNNASTEQNKGFSATTSTGTISISNTTFQQAFQPGSTAYSNGATLSAPVINLTNVTAKGNDGSGVYVDGTGITPVNVFGGTYINNKRYGIEAINSILNEQSAPICSGNVLSSVANPCYIVKDTRGPILNLPADISIVVNDLSRAVVTYSASATDLIEGPVPVSCAPVSGSVFPLGMTVVNCSAADSAGNTTHGSFNVTVDVDKVAKLPLYSVTKQTQAQLPGALGQGNSFVSALKLEFLDPAAKMQNMEITLSFPISENMKNSDLVVMFWDGLKWVAIPGGNVVDNYFVITVTQPGFYVLVSE